MNRTLPARAVQQVLLGVVRGYRFFLKPWLGNACRFEPTCSAYAMQALQLHGPWRGTALAGWRLLRCHPWCDGGCDPVPDNAPPAARSAAEDTRSDSAAAQGRRAQRQFRKSP